MRLTTAVLMAGATIMLAFGGLRAAVQTKAVEYKDGDVTLEGFLAWDDAAKGKQPGVLVVHEWWGLNEYPKQRAKQLAEMGYVAFAVDMYGKGVVAKTPAEAKDLAGKVKGDRKLMRSRVLAGLEAMRKQEQVDGAKIAAIGYCFGGTTVLELARGGADVLGVVSFHGGLDSPAPADGKNIKCKVLVQAGADDPFQKPEDLTAFESEMRDAKVDWEITFYGGAVHSFTQPSPGFVNPGAHYNEKADKRSWAAMKHFFTEIFN